MRLTIEIFLYRIEQGEVIDHIKLPNPHLQVTTETFSVVWGIDMYGTRFFPVSLGWPQGTSAHCMAYQARTVIRSLILGCTKSD